MTIRVLINGAKGRMGLVSVQTIQNDSAFNLVGTTNRGDDLKAAIKDCKADVVLDFTTADCVQENTAIIIAAGARPVIGTSGLLKPQILTLKADCKQLKLGGIIAPNFSLGAVLLMKYSQEIARYFPDVEIIEMHHDGKLDSPSGTALRTAEMLAVNIQASAPKKNKDTIPGARGASHHHIPIHSIRLPGLVAHEQVIFGGIGETLTLRHDSIDRISFMPGVVLACKKVMELDELVYGLENVL